jgi:aspartate/methionine/tyrosine aminotransferase
MPLTLSELGEAVLATQYAVRGPIVARAQELERSGRKIIYCNIGNPQSLGQKPLSYLRQVLALAECPELAGKAPGAFPEDVKAAVDTIMAGSKFGLGAYSDSKGLKFVRDAVAAFIEKRDSDDALRVKADPDQVYLTDGASKGVQAALRLLIASDRDGIMIPIPQYPLYSATITLYGGKQVGYFLDEKAGWSLSRKNLEEAYEKATAEGTRVRALCVINPGNPTGSLLSRDNIAMVIGFAKEHGLSILADEVYQENIYRAGDKFVSFARVLAELGEKDVSLFSFHSCSKGFLGECGQRGGYMEVRNIPPDVLAQITKLQSVSLCANLPGQILVYLMVKPPKPGDPSWELYDRERRGVLAELARRAKSLAEGLNRIPGYSCQPITGAMYAFPTIKIPSGRTDDDYCMALLESTGICVVPGTGFGQTAGTAHFRTTILPPAEQLEEVVKKIAEFHASWR